MVTAGIAGIFDGNLLAVLVGWKSRTNAGVIAMALACLIKVFFMDGSVNQVIEAWPLKIVFYLIAIALFFNYATANGTMDRGKKNAVSSARPCLSDSVGDYGCLCSRVVSRSRGFNSGDHRTACLLTRTKSRDSSDFACTLGCPCNYDRRGEPRSMAMAG
ncbi:MAG: hypothetical protein V8S27_04745 [Lachnospiraceae bacterium]